MASFDLPDTPQPRVSPALMVGAASPLWSYFAAAAAGGLAYWWMTQWARPVNLEAMFGRAPALPVPTAFEPVVDAVEAAAETIAEAAPELPPLAVGGEAAPISPFLEVASATEPEPTVEPQPLEAGEEMFAAAPEPVIDEPAPVSAEAAIEAAPKLRAKKPAAPLPETDA